MLKENHKEIHFGRRDFIITTALASVAATFPSTRPVSRDIESPSKAKPGGMKRKLLCLCDSPPAYRQFIESIQSIPGTDIQVSSIKVNYQKPEEIIQTIHGKDADILLLCLPRFTFSFGILYDSMGDLNIPIIVLSSNPDLILIDANLVASLRANGANATFAISQRQAFEILKILAAPRILEDRRALLYGRPFDSTSVPAHNLTEDLVYKRTGVRIQYRPIEELAALFKDVDESSARSEMERWKKEAVEVNRVSDKTILDASRLYILLRSIIEKEGLSAISLDCTFF